MNNLRFAELREANKMRLPLFKNCHGGQAHSKEDGSDWSPAQWLQAVVGELGEYSNLRKKFERGDIAKDQFLLEAAHELADTVTYIDILAFQLGIDLGEAVEAKFNVVSRRVGCDVELRSEDENRVPYGMLNELLVHVKRLRQTAPVDDDFPEMMHNVDSMLRAIDNHKEVGQ